jgi:hypothetical protein
MMERPREPNSQYLSIKSEYKLPRSTLGGLFGVLVVKRMLERWGAEMVENLKKALEA